MGSSSSPFKVVISHAEEDKATIAIPLRQMLKDNDIKAFVYEVDKRPGTLSPQAMPSEMQTADVGVTVLSPEFVARKGPMKELMCFLKRREDASAEGTTGPTVIPVFYRLSRSDLYDEPKLDRVDKDGASLYYQSHFFERMNNGEPEANVSKIRKALQKLRKLPGVKNFVDASNDSSYIMSSRREILLQEIYKAVREAIGFHDAYTLADASNTFQPHFDQPRDTSDLVLDFLGRDKNGRPKTIEGRLLEKVCDHSTKVNRTIAVEGIAGVGKTCLLHGLCSIRQVIERFKGGIYFLKLGEAATLKYMKDELSIAVAKAGGDGDAKRLRSETDWKKAIDLFRLFFEGKQCLFMFADVWANEELSSDIVHSLMSLHRSSKNRVSREDNKVLLTTRSVEVAKRAGSRFQVNPRDTYGPEARAMLVKYSGITPDENRDGLAIEEILGKCGGLPKSIELAGRTVKSLSYTSRGRGSLSYHLYAFSLAGGRERTQLLPGE